MDLTPLSVEPPGLPITIELLLLSAAGYFVVRRWPRALPLIVAIAVGLSLELVHRELPLAPTLRDATWRWYILEEFALCTAAIASGLGLPLLAWRATRRSTNAAIAPTSTPTSFDRQPVLDGEHVALRPLRPEDYDALYAVAVDPLIWEQHPASDRHEPSVFRKFFNDALASGGAFLVLDRADGRVIGSSRYFGYDAERSEVEIGWTFLARTHWGGRYNGEMKELMLRHAFQYVDRVVFLVGPHNVRSQRAVERIGATRAGTRTDPTGRESVVYEMTAATFAARQR